MKKMLLIILAIGLCFAQANAGLRVIVGGGVPAASATCQSSALYNENASNDYWELAVGANYQYVNNASSIEICQIDVEMYWSGTTGNCHLELWSDAAMAGTQYGSDSETIAINVNSPGTIFTFTFVINPEVSGNFYVHFIEESGSLRVRVSTDNTTGLGDESYDFISGGSDRNDDAAMTIYTMQ